MTLIPASQTLHIRRESKTIISQIIQTFYLLVSCLSILWMKAIIFQTSTAYTLSQINIKPDATEVVSSHVSMHQTVPVWTSATGIMVRMFLLQLPDLPVDLNYAAFHRPILRRALTSIISMTKTSKHFTLATEVTRTADRSLVQPADGL